MTPERYQQIKELYQSALELEPEKRLSWLAEACATDEELFRDVETLLAEAGETRTFLEPLAQLPVVPLRDALGSPLAMLGQMIGPYKILRELGQGGMGTVFLAERADEEFQKRVALKLVKRGMDTDDILARFRHERQILASLDHPHIARLLDGGTTTDGLPYFVMEHIEGQPIDKYCAAHKLTTEQRLQLFRTVCDAVHYAHQNLVVHRDLKPSNILVTPASEGNPGTVKLLDFGIAKILNPDMFPDTVLPTRTWDRPMTPAYASPEQVRGQQITTASDVYSLGVILYELLTGQRPYEVKGIAPHEIAQIVCETEPVRPSTAVIRSVTTKEDSGVNKTAGTDADRLRRRLQGDLDNIVLMALRKEPARRYASVEQFSEDIRRHLAGLPVIAREDTFGYRAEKFIKRNQVAVAAAGVFALLLVAFVVTLLLQSQRVRRERDLAQAERDKAAQVSRFLVELFKVNDPSEAKGNQITARELLDKGAERIKLELQAQPALQANLMHTMGDAYRSLGLFDRALPLLENALQTRQRLYGNENVETAETLQNLALLRMEHGDFAEAEPLARAALDARRKLYGDNHKAIASSLNNLGYLFYLKREYQTAEPLFRQAIEMQRGLLGDEDAELASYQSNLGTLLQETRRTDEAEPLLRQALNTSRKLLGEAHPTSVSNLNNLAVLLLNKQDLAGAEQAFRELVAAGRKLYGEENHHVGLYLANLGYVLTQRGNNAEAETILRRALEIRSKVFPADNPEVGHSAILLGRLLTTQGKFQEAEPLLRRAVETFRNKFPKTSTMTADAENVLGACLTGLRRYDEAEPLLLKSYETIYAVKGNKTKLAQTALDRLARLYDAKGQPAKAAQYRAALQAEQTQK